MITQREHRGNGGNFILLCGQVALIQIHHQLVYCTHISVAISWEILAPAAPTPPGLSHNDNNSLTFITSNLSNIVAVFLGLS